MNDILSRRAIRSLALALVIVAPMACGFDSPARAQLPANKAGLPAAIYWKQDLFLIPYQLNSGVGSGGAQTVRLFVSRDSGATWQSISEAKPNVKAFNYRAAGEGEYWFAVRTVDAVGRAWPAGAYQPELRVIVDKTMPRIDACEALVRDDGLLQLRWAATDTHLNGASWRLEVQTEGASTWELVSLPNSAGALGAGQADWRSPTGRQPSAVRASVSDLAGNSASTNVAVSRSPAERRDLPEAKTPTEPQWTSASAAPSKDGPPASPTFRPDPQSWPASVGIRYPYRLFDDDASLPQDAATRFGNPQLNAAAAGEAGAERSEKNETERPSFAPLQPFRQASLRRLPPTGEEAGSMEQGAGSKKQGNNTALLPAPSSLLPAPLPPGVEAKQVASRTFALEYQLQDIGRWGVSRVELWGSRNGGQSWRRYAQDDDLRSPLRVTVDEEGVYGFRIVAEGAGGVPAPPPQKGDAPELWVEVDLHRPYAELTSIVPGSGNRADQLVLHWRAEDDNLESRPVALLYSSRPVGPWSAIATSLENTGEYAWRVERHVPERCFLRLEVRDKAGNLGAYQTLEPVSLAIGQPSVKVRAVEPADAEALSSGALHR